MAFARGYSQPWPPAFLEGITEEQSATLQMPYNNFYDRATLDSEGTVDKNKKSRNPEKMRFDEQVFGEKYY